MPWRKWGRDCVDQADRCLLGGLRDTRERAGKAPAGPGSKLRRWIGSSSPAAAVTHHHAWGASGESPSQRWSLKSKTLVSPGRCTLRGPEAKLSLDSWGPGGPQHSLACGRTPAALPGPCSSLGPFLVSERLGEVRTRPRQLWVPRCGYSEWEEGRVPGGRDTFRAAGQGRVGGQG